MSTPTSIEALLIEAHLVDENALRQARRVALRRHLPLIEVLVDEHAVDGQQIAAALSERLALPRIDPSKLVVDEEALREVPHDLAAAHLVVPIHLESEGSRRMLHLAMANPLDTFALEDIAHSSGCTLERTVASIGEVRAAIQRSYRGLITRMIPRMHDGLYDNGEAVRANTEPTTHPHVQLPDETSLEVRVRALIELLAERNLISTTELEDRIRRIVKGEDV